MSYGFVPRNSADRSTGPYYRQESRLLPGTGTCVGKRQQGLYSLTLSGRSPVRQGIKAQAAAPIPAPMPAPLGVRVAMAPIPAPAVVVSTTVPTFLPLLPPPVTLPSESMVSLPPESALRGAARRSTV